MRFPNPQDTIIFDRTQSELECFLLFCIVVAGKKASTQVKFLESFLKLGDNTKSPFENIREMDKNGKLVENLQISKLGQYTRLACCFRELTRSNIDLSNCTIEELENVHGIGAKTSRFFITCNRENARHAVLDTHILRFINQYLKINAPSATPSNKKEYARLESAWLKYVDSLGVKSVDLDLAVWKMYSNRDDSDYQMLLNKSSLLSIQGVNQYA